MKKVFVHIGAPKTGTSQLQDLLYINREGLRAKGVLYPAERFDHQFLAALDLIGKSWGGLEDEAVGAWPWLVEQVNGFDGNVVVSHRSEEHTSELQSLRHLVCRLLPERK